MAGGRRKPGSRSSIKTGKTYQRIVAGSCGKNKIWDKNLKFGEQACRLLGTINSPETTDAVRRAARKTLEERILERKDYLTTEINKLLKLQSNRPPKAYEEHDLKINEKGLAEVELVKALFEGEKSTGERVKRLTEKVLKLKEEVGEMQKRMNR